MSSDVARRQSLLEVMAAKVQMDPQTFQRTLAETVFKADPPLSVPEFAAACVICNKYDLDPISREIHVTRSRGRLLTMVSIDGWLKIAHRSGQLDGIEFQEQFTDADEIHAVTCTVYRKDQSRPTVYTAYRKEYDRQNEVWKTYTIRMLRHKAAKEALRYAFAIAGIDHEEMDELPPERPDAAPKPTKVIVGNVSTRLAEPVPTVVEPQPAREPGEDREVAP